MTTHNEIMEQSAMMKSLVASLNEQGHEIDLFDLLDAMEDVGVVLTQYGVFDKGIRSEAFLALLGDGVKDDAIEYLNDEELA